MAEKNIFKEALDGLKTGMSVQESVSWLFKNYKAIKISLEGYAASVEADKDSPRWGG